MIRSSLEDGQAQQSEARDDLLAAWVGTSGSCVNFFHMGVFRVLSGVLGAGSAGLALAERMGASAAGEAQIHGEAVDLAPVEDWNLTYPSRSESAALLDAALDRTRNGAGPAAP